MDPKIVLIDMVLGHLLSAIEYSNLYKEKGGNITMEDVRALEAKNEELRAQFEANRQA